MCDTRINCLKGYGGSSQGWRTSYRMFSYSRNFKHFSCTWVSSTLSFLFACSWQLCSLKYFHVVVAMAMSHTRSCVFTTSGSDWSLWDVLISGSVTVPRGSGCSGWPTWDQVSCSVFMSGESSNSFCRSNDQVEVKQFPIEMGWSVCVCVCAIIHKMKDVCFAGKMGVYYTFISPAPKKVYCL